MCCTLILRLISLMISSGSVPSISLRFISLPSLSSPIGRFREISDAFFWKHVYS